MSKSYQTYTPETLVQQLEQSVNGNRVVFARGGLAVTGAGIFYGIHLYPIADGRLTEALRGSIARDDWAPCLAACRARYETTLGAMTEIEKEPLVWTDQPPGFCAWFGGRPIWTLVEGALRGEAVEIPSDDIQAVERFVTDDWVTRGVHIVQTDGSSTVVVSAQCDYVVGNYTYDAEELREDTVWAGRLGRSLAASLQRPYVDMLG